MRNKKYYQYALDVTEGRIVTGELMKLACQRFLDDLKRDDLEFRPDKVDYAIEFISILKHFTGKSSGQPFVLQPFQEFITANILGFYWKESGTRRYTSSYIEMSRKQGKTAFAGALAMYFLIADGEDGAEVDFAANSKEQAKIAFTFAQQFSRQLDRNQKTLKVYRDSISIEENASKIRVFAADDSKLDGFNASASVVDEFHAAKNSRVRDVIKSSMGMRENPHLMVITTAGFDKTGPCYQLRCTGVDILKKFKTDDSMFIAIWCLDIKDDWRQPENWVKCAPNLNVTVKESYIRDMVNSAINNPSEEVPIRTKVLNEWCDVAEVWITDSYINNCRGDADLETARGQYVYMGVDLASVSDMTCVAYCWKPKGSDKFHFKVDCYLPEDTLIKGANADLYKIWKELGYLKVTPGNITDYNYITADILENQKKYNFVIHSINYDAYNSLQWATDAQCNHGLPLTPYSQSVFNFNKPTRELERLILSHNCLIDKSEAVAWCFRNVRLRRDSNDNVKPDKKDTQVKKIDAVIAIIEALAGWYTHNVDGWATATSFNM